MGRSTKLILTADCYGDGDVERTTNLLNAFMVAQDERWQMSSLPRGVFGGDKVFTPAVWAGAFKQFPLREFINHARNLMWKVPQSVRLFVYENDEIIPPDGVCGGGWGFTSVPIFCAHEEHGAKYYLRDDPTLCRNPCSRGNGFRYWCDKHAPASAQYPLPGLIEYSDT